MIGIIGYGYVGKAVSNSFNCEQIICDPKYNDNTIQDLISREPEAIFVCVPTPSNDEKFVIQLVQDTDKLNLILTEGIKPSSMQISLSALLLRA